MGISNSIFKFLGNYNTPVSSKTLGIFRIVFTLHLLLILEEVYTYRQLIFDAVPGTSIQVFPVMVYLFIWFISLIFLLTGTYTRIAAIINYLFIVMSTSLFMNAHVGTFNDDLLRIGSFLCIFLPVSKSFSFDAILKNLRHRQLQPEHTSKLNSLLFIFLSLGLLYFPSGITKLYSPMWNHGLGLWIPLNLPHNKWNELPNLLVNHEYFLYAINWIVIIWEIAFVFLIFKPSMHKWIVIPGLIFHAGIALLFPFPAVCTGPYPFYLLFIPDSFWKKVSDYFNTSEKQIIQYSQNSKSDNALVALVQSFDFRNRFNFISENVDGRIFTAEKALELLSSYWIYSLPIAFIKVTNLRRPISFIYYSLIADYLSIGTKPAFNYKGKQTIFIYFVITCTAMQLAISCYHFYSHFNSGAEKRMEYMRKRKEGYDLSMKPTNLMRTFLGINSRGLFLDHANSGQKTTYAIVRVLPDGKEEWLPLIDSRGYVSREMNMNMAWAKVTFNLMGFSTSPADSSGVKKLTRFWMLKHGISNYPINFRVYGKTYTYPDHFETDYYKKLEAQPWFTEGEATWTDSGFVWQRIRNFDIQNTIH